MNIIYFIRKNSKQQQNICFRLRDGREVDLHFKSDIKIDVADWDYTNNKLKQPSGNIKDDRKKYLTGKKDDIDNLSKIIRDIYLSQTETEGLTSDWLEDAIDRSLHPEKYIEVIQSEPYLLAYIDNFIMHAPERTKKRENTYVSNVTIKSYVANRNRLKSFLDYKKKKDVLMSEVDGDFCEAYIRFLTNKKRTVRTKKGEVVNEVKQYAKNTIGDAVKALKTMLADAPTAVNVKDLYVYKEDAESVYLNEAELQQLKDCDFSAVPYLDRVRDWFLLLAWTGSRFSDLGKIDKANIKNGLITYRQKKTNTSVTIPLHPVVSEILQKYDFDMPELISNQKFNDYIKEACKLAGIDHVESVTRTVGGKLTTETMPKYELISSHTCRRSFCTNMYLRGLDTMMIRSISGHKTEVSFLKYIKVSQKQHAERMAEKWSEIYK